MDYRQKNPLKYYILQSHNLDAYKYHY